jgi:hypothetical protein
MRLLNNRASPEVLPDTSAAQNTATTKTAAPL